jgi:hypothetical protein
MMGMDKMFFERLLLKKKNCYREITIHFYELYLDTTKWVASEAS